VLGLIRQESSFDPLASSAAGARGLMQLMPATASQLARGLHAPAGPLGDPVVNMRLGTAYLGGLLAQFGGVVPYAVAAYDAGGRHVRDWMAANGNAAAPPDADAMIDWIELIPYAETRNYVQRVLENQAVYQARALGPAGWPVRGEGPG
jgi:soluble lytic murein transglycosylase